MEDQAPPAPQEIPLPPGQTPAEPDFFGGVSDTKQWFLPGSGTQYIEFSIMNEGQRKKFQKKTNRSVKVGRNDKTAEIGFDPAGDRESLLLEVVVGWTLIDPATQQVAPFSNSGPGGLFAQWMNRADPMLIDKLEVAIRDANPWMQDDMDPESIREEITRLEKMEAEAIARRDEKANF